MLSWDLFEHKRCFVFFLVCFFSFDLLILYPCLRVLWEMFNEKDC